MTSKKGLVCQYCSQVDHSMSRESILFDILWIFFQFKVALDHREAVRAMCSRQPHRGEYLPKNSHFSFGIINCYPSQLEKEVRCLYR